MDVGGGAPNGAIGDFSSRFNSPATYQPNTDCASISLRRNNKGRGCDMPIAVLGTAEVMPGLGNTHPFQPLKAARGGSHLHGGLRFALAIELGFPAHSEIVASECNGIEDEALRMSTVVGSMSTVVGGAEQGSWGVSGVSRRIHSAAARL